VASSASAAALAALVPPSIRPIPLGGATPADLGALVPEGCVGEGLQRVVQVAELVRDPGERLRRVKPPVQGVDLVAEPVEPLEERVELTVVQMLSRLGHGN
jgi:hypothetical protein